MSFRLLEYTIHDRSNSGNTARIVLRIDKGIDRFLDCSSGEVGAKAEGMINRDPARL